MRECAARHRARAGLAGVLLLLLLVACNDDEAATATPGSASPTVTSTATAAPSLTSTAIPIVTETAEPSAVAAGGWPPALGLPQIDAVLAALEAGDWAAFLDQVPVAEQPCTTALGAGGPPKCAPGTGDGTVVQFLPYFECDGWGAEEGLRARILDESASPLAVLAYDEPVASWVAPDERRVTHALLMIFDGYGDQPSDARLLTTIGFDADRVFDVASDCGAYSLTAFEAGELPTQAGAQVLWSAYAAR